MNRRTVPSCGNARPSYNILSYSIRVELKKRREIRQSSSGPSICTQINLEKSIFIDITGAKIEHDHHETALAFFPNLPFVWLFCTHTLPVMRIRCIPIELDHYHYNRRAYKSLIFIYFIGPRNVRLDT